MILLRVKNLTPELADISFKHIFLDLLNMTCARMCPCLDIGAVGPLAGNIWIQYEFEDQNEIMKETVGSEQCW